jgi:putative ABC transport system permease protein
LVLLTGFGFGLVPALQATRVKLNDVLKDGGRGSSASKGGLKLRNLLVISEIAFALVLLVSAGLFTRSFLKIQNVDYGYQLKDLYTASIKLSQRKYPEAQSQINFVNQALERVTQVHGVGSAAFFNLIGAVGFTIAGQPEGPLSNRPSAQVTSVTPDYFETLVIPLLRGRPFTSHDLAGASPVIIINEELARLYFPDKDPIGQRLNLVIGTDPPLWRVVIGVVGNVRDTDGNPGSPLRSQVYLPFTQYPYFSLGFFVRPMAGIPLDIRAVSGVVRSLNQEIPFSMLWEATTFIDKGMPAVRRFSMVLSVVFSSIALLLAAVGIYGVMAFNVAQRTSEIGIRMALGAQGTDVMRMVLLNGGRMVGIGLLIGIAGALAAARFLGSLLYELSAYDPVTLGIITLMLAGVGFLACWVPARRASKIDPLVALRME